MADSRELFRRFSHRVSMAVGSAGAFLIALATVATWALTGPIFGYSDTWQLVINTGTTVVTFLVVFIIQNTQNRDAQAIHLKLDELIRASGGARNELVELEELSDQALEELHAEFHQLREQYAAKVEQISEVHGRRREDRRKRGRPAEESE